MVDRLGNVQYWAGSAFAAVTGVTRFLGAETTP
jgi:hypothetical protein